MGERKLPKNVEVHGNSLRVKFFFEGKWRRLSLRVPPEPANIKFAARELARIELEIAAGTFDFCRHFPRTAEARRREALAREPTVAELYERWIASKSAHRASTLRRYAGAYRLYIGPTFGGSTFRELKLSDLKVWSAELARRISPYTANKARAVFHDLGTFAVMDGRVDTNPLNRLPEHRRTAEPAEAFDADECARLVAGARDALDRHLALFDLLTGLRLGELFGLRWEDVDWGNRQLWVRRNLSPENGETGTKTHRERRVDLVEDALAVLRAQQESGTKRNVFESGGKPVSVNSFRDRWTPWLKRAEVPYRNPYTMRHTYASRLISAGLPPAYVATQLGHSVQILLSVYARWLPRERPDLEAVLKIGPPVGHPAVD